MSSEHADVVRDSAAWVAAEIVEPRRAEEALGAAVQETCLNGVSTRKVDRLLEQPGIASVIPSWTAAAP
jgi:transposase-like protein